jgi:glycosyltransferase involved in cell wall biosynthesis
VPSGRIRVIPGGADHERFHPAADKRTVRSALGLPEAGVIFFTVRNLVPRMGIDALIRAMGRIAGEISHARLVIGGEGPMRPSLEALVDALGLRKRIRFVGFIPEAELPLYYQAADFFILPTAQLEGFGLVTVEALASGLPVLGTRVGGTPEILEPLDPTWLFDTPEPAAMAERIVTIVREFSPTSARYGILAIRCRRRVEEHYTWTRHLDQLERLYAQLRRR